MKETQKHVSYMLLTANLKEISSFLLCSSVASTKTNHTCQLVGPAHAFTYAYMKCAECLHFRAVVMTTGRPTTPL